MPPAPWESGPEAERKLEAFRAYEYTSKAARQERELQDSFEKLVSKQYGWLRVQEAAKLRLAEERNPRGPLVSLTDADLVNRPEPEWWIDGILQKGTVAVLAGPPGLGKSFLSLYWARCIASGTPAFTRTVRPGRVLYVVAEGAASFGKRVRAWDATHPMSRVPAGAVSYVESGVNLSSEDSVAELREVFRSGDFDICVLDTYSQLSGVTDENSAAENARVLNAVRSIREVKEGASVVLVHHTDARATKARGSTTLTANVDTVIMLKPDASDGFSLSTRLEDGGKQKDGRPEKVPGFKLVDHEPTRSAVIEWTGKSPVSPWWAPIRDALASGEWMGGGELREAVGIAELSGPDYESFKRALTQCVHLKVIEKDGERRTARYRLVPIPGAS